MIHFKMFDKAPGKEAQFKVLNKKGKQLRIDIKEANLSVMPGGKGMVTIKFPVEDIKITQEGGLTCVKFTAVAPNEDQP